MVLDGSGRDLSVVWFSIGLVELRETAAGGCEKIHQTLLEEGMDQAFSTHGIYEKLSENPKRSDH
jgi:hypothetical protein